MRTGRAEASARTLDLGCDAEEANALAREAAEGDPFATRRLLESMRPLLTRVVAGVLGAHSPDLDDVVQQSLLALVRSLSAFRGECHAAGYASRIALHEALRTRRRARAETHRRDAMARLTSNEEQAAGDDESLLAERRRKLTRDLLDELPVEQADAFGLRVILGCSLEEVATATGAPLNTVRSRVRLAKEALRRRIEAAPDLADELAGSP